MPKMPLEAPRPILPAGFYQCCGSGMFILDPGSRIRLFSIPDPGSRIRTVSIPDPGSRIVKEFKYFNPKKPKKWFLSSKKIWYGLFHPGSRIPMLTFSHPGSRIPDPGVKKHPIPDPGSRIRIRNTGFYIKKLVAYLNNFQRTKSFCIQTLTKLPELTVLSWLTCVVNNNSPQEGFVRVSPQKSVRKCSATASVSYPAFIEEPPQ
jgi:hypothetical protein